ncbi:RF-1 domain-containing protein [Ditylenchus destructor]|nr:RF-1 domain-containing protein [Ditylenchus destructor]
MLSAAFPSTSAFLVRFNSSWARRKLKGYVFPVIEQKDCEKKPILGWGPGGQKVNKSQNAIYVRHVPTGCSVKVHESRLLLKNEEIALEKLKLKVDRHLNGDNCYEEQLQRLEREHQEKMARSAAKQREFRANLKVEEAKTLERIKQKENKMSDEVKDE